MNMDPHDSPAPSSSFWQQPRVEDLLSAALSDLDAVNVELTAAMQLTAAIQLVLPSQHTGELEAALSRATQRASSWRNTAVALARRAVQAPATTKPASRRKCRSLEMQQQQQQQQQQSSSASSLSSPDAPTPAAGAEDPKRQRKGPMEAEFSKEFNAGFGSEALNR